MKYEVQLNEDSTYNYFFHFHIMTDISSGRWKQEGNMIRLVSNVQDVGCFPLTKKHLPFVENNRDCLILKNISHEFYYWQLVINDDTLRILQDTVPTGSYSRPYSVILMARPLTGSELRQACHMTAKDISHYYLPFDTCFVRSESVLIHEKGAVEIAADSVFGDRPFNYLAIKDKKVFKIKKQNYIQDVWKCYSLVNIE